MSSQPSQLQQGPPSEKSKVEQFRSWIGQKVNGLRRGNWRWLLLGIALGVTLTLLVGQWRWVIGLGILIAILGAQDWFREKFFLYSTIAVVILAFAFLSLWLVVNLIWPASYGVRQVQLLSDKYPGNAIEVNAPKTILADDKPVALTVSSVIVPARDRDLKVRIVLPSTVALVDARQQRETELTFTSAEPLTATVFLANRRTFTGLSLVQNLTFIVSEGSEKPVSGDTEISIEGEIALALRTFVNSAVDERSPLIILVAGLISAAGWLFTQYWLRADNAT
jgi:hypothetical protein